MSAPAQPCGPLQLAAPATVPRLPSPTRPLLRGARPLQQQPAAPPRLLRRPGAPSPRRSTHPAPA